MARLTKETDKCSRRTDTPQRTVVYAVCSICGKDIPAAQDDPNYSGTVCKDCKNEDHN